MRNKVIYFVGIIFLCSIYSVFADEAGNDKIEMFVSGSEFDSMRQYRLERVQRFLSESLPDFSCEEYSLFVNALFKEFSVDEFSDFTEEELKVIIREVFLRGAILKDKRDKKTKSISMDMEALMDLYKKERGIKTPTNINMNSMKTIDIKK